MTKRPLFPSPSTLHHPTREFSLNKLSSALLRGIGLTACVASLGAISAGTAWGDDKVQHVHRAPDGRNGGMLLNLYREATPGFSAVPMSHTQGDAIRNVTSSAIEVGSVGGRGGSVTSSDPFHDMAGKPGGYGGAATLIVLETADISGTLRYALKPSEQSSPLIHVYSEGGTGGRGYLTSREGGISRGGDGGSVTLGIASKITAASGANPQGVSAPAIRAASKGGNAGVDDQGRESTTGTLEHRVAIDIGGHGGRVHVELEKTAQVTVSGALGPAIVASSEGGNGGRATPNLTRGYPSNAGDGQAVVLRSAGDITTKGNNSAAVILQSVGGQGGQGGGGIFTSGTPGSRGGSGGKVEALNNGSISTAGDYSFGIVAQSVGGSGGIGGSSAFISGGTGGGAGLGGTVFLDNKGSIVTKGTGASAIVAQSIGGGNALDAFNAAKPGISSGGGGAGGKSGILPFASGGAGGLGGVGGRVDIQHSGAITTAGNAAHGVLAQSIGGGGGTGGQGSSSGAFLAVALGGAGGSGGIGGMVTFNSSGGRIETSGKDAIAVLLQSIGGGGGTGGYATSMASGYGLSAASATGGSGGKGGKGGIVRLYNINSPIITRGQGSTGLQATSIGGGGGTGGGASSLAISLPAINPTAEIPVPSIAVSNSVGGSGGEGGSGERTEIYNHRGSTIQTYGVGATGILSQSIGGGGGNAGNAFAYGLAIAAPDVPALTIVESVGGSGGSGGSGYIARVGSTAKVLTHGDDAVGILVQSIGGGGGTAGSATVAADALSLKATATITKAVGGSNVDGGSGGNGGHVSVDTDSLIETRGVGATGVLLQSVGGGGGKGGAVRSSASSGLYFDKSLNNLVQKLPLADSVHITESVGGSGGKGGSGSTAEIMLRADSKVRTFGAQADGVLVQSIGGGGGVGGAGSTTAQGTLIITSSVGGTGGAGGAGGVAAARNLGSIETYGDASNGILAQSIGGGGGNGGALSAAPDDTPDTVGQVWATLKNAVGVDAYQKWAADNTNAQTKEALDLFIKHIQDSNAYKSLADAFKSSDFHKEMQAAQKKVTGYLSEKSKGAVKLPNVSLTLAIGGHAGVGNKGENVKVQNLGTIITHGAHSHGILAQSIGGGGGNGGVAYASGTSKINVSGTWGGRGGSGNTGGTVEIDNEQGVIDTHGDAAYGVFAQSIGGGGGTGIGSFSSGNKNIVANYTSGGNGGSGAHGGSIRVLNASAITTRGDEAHAIVAQSVGGGGGAFMMHTPKDTATLPPDDGQAVSTDSMAELLKAVGIHKVPSDLPDTDDKAPAKSGSFTYGGHGGASGSGGDIRISQGSVAIQTSGMAAFGILAQSIGGGGGLSNSAGNPGGVKYAVSYGGSGGTAGNGGAIGLDFKDGASIQTSGDYSTAIFAQSIGGGGGYGGASVLQGWTIPVLSGVGGTSGNGGNITIGATKADKVSIITEGAKAHGIFAQSLGGGGGLISDSLKTDATVRATLEKTSATLNDIVKKFGKTGTILDHINQIPAEFQPIVRLFANDKDTVDSALTKLTDSLNKRGASQGTGGQIKIQLAGNIETIGSGSYGIFAQSGFQQSNGSLDPNRPGGNIDITYYGNIFGGADDGAGIVVDGGKTNQIVIERGASVNALSGNAVIATFGEDTLINRGMLIGSIDLAHGGTKERNTFINEAPGLFISNPNGKIAVSNGAGLFRNTGTFDIGGFGTIATAKISVDTYLGGTLITDVTSFPLEGQRNADLLQASTLVIDGVNIKPYAVYGLLPGSFDVISASSVQTKKPATAGVSRHNPISWAATQHGNTISITPSANFVGKAPGALSDTERSLLQSLQNAWDTNDAAAARLFAHMADIDSAETYSMVINSLTASEDIGRAASGQMLAGRESLSKAFSCPLFEGTGVTLRERQCVWSNIGGSRTNYNPDTTNDGFSRDTRHYRMGAQWEVRPNWFVGATGAYNTSKMHTNDGLTSIKGDSGDLSFSLKHQAGSWLLGAALHAGYGSYDSNSMFTIGRDTWTASNTNDVWTTGLRLRAAYDAQYENWYVQPSVNLDVLRTYMPSYTLTGDNATLHATATKAWTVAVEPAVEAGTRIEMGKYGWLRPYVSAGVAFINNSGLNNEVTFSENGQRAIAFSSSTRLPKHTFNLGAGVQLFAKDKYELRAEYKTQIGSDYRKHELSLRGAMVF